MLLESAIGWGCKAPHVTWSLRKATIHFPTVARERPSYFRPDIRRLSSLSLLVILVGVVCHTVPKSLFCPSLEPFLDGVPVLSDIERS